MGDSPPRSDSTANIFGNGSWKSRITLHAEYLGAAAVHAARGIFTVGAAAVRAVRGMRSVVGLEAPGEEAMFVLVTDTTLP